MKKMMLPLLVLVFLSTCNDSSSYYITITNQNGKQKKDTITAISDSAAYTIGISTFINQLIHANAAHASDGPALFQVTDAGGNDISKKMSIETILKIEKPLQELLRDTVISISGDSTHTTTTMPVDTTKK